MIWRVLSLLEKEEYFCQFVHPTHPIADPIRLPMLLQDIDEHIDSSGQPCLSEAVEQNLSPVCAPLSFWDP